MDYDALLATVGALTQDRSQVEQVFRLMTFNVLAHNKDDHVRNFAFVHYGQAGWKLSPAFDLTFSAGMGGEHMTAIGGQGNPALEHVLTIGSKHRIANAARIVGEVRDAVAQWPALAKKWAVLSDSASAIQKALAKIDKRFGVSS
jgi:serine/threonine-protein kinase HipA